MPFYGVEYEIEIRSVHRRVRKTGHLSFFFLFSGNEYIHDSASKSVQVLEAGLPAEMQVGATQPLPGEVMSVVPASL